MPDAKLYQRLIEMRKVIPIEVENSICPQRWDYLYVNMGRGETKMCCLTSFYKITQEDIEKHGSDSLINNDYYKERRLEMLQGIRHSDCKYCWDLEDSNIESPRQAHYKINKNYENTRNYLLDNWNENIDINSELLVSKNPELLELTLDATCDLKCMYCSPGYSTQWATESLKNGTISIERYREFTAEPTSEFRSLVSKWMTTESGKKISFIRISGGEPLIISDFYDVLDNIASQYSNLGLISIEVVTNCNAKEKYFSRFKESITLLSTRFKIAITISMEAVENQAEYIRTGLDWNRFNSNVNELCAMSSNNKNIQVTFNATINVLSVPRLDCFLLWVINLETNNQIRIKINTKIVKSPECHSIFILPSSFSKYIDSAISVLKNSKISHTKYYNFLVDIKNRLEVNVPDEKLQREFYKWFENFDAMRNLNLIETFPEFKEFYEYCKNK